MNTLTLIKDALLHLIYPHICAGCGTDALPSTSQLCIKCIHDLPLTRFETQANNPVEKILAGRVPFLHATAQIYFHKHSALQRLMHQFKYRGNKDLGLQLGLIMGYQLLESGRFGGTEALVPLPLHESREKQRGYNQAEILCNGIAQILQVPVLKGAVKRTIATGSQTKKSRIDRWQNIAGKFELGTNQGLQNKQVLLVDDIITTGATLDACGNALLKIKGLTLNVATLCYASKI